MGQSKEDRAAEVAAAEHVLSGRAVLLGVRVDFSPFTPDGVSIELKLKPKENGASAETVTILRGCGKHDDAEVNRVRGPWMERLLSGGTAGDIPSTLALL